jgi:hypothetical protein
LDVEIRAMNESQWAVAIGLAAGVAGLFVNAGSGVAVAPDVPNRDGRF